MRGRDDRRDSLAVDFKAGNGAQQRGPVAEVCGVVVFARVDSLLFGKEPGSISTPEIQQPRGVVPARSMKVPSAQEVG